MVASRALRISPKISPKKKGTSQPSETVSESTIAVLAYQLWQERGCPIGSDQDDWFQAEKELKERTGLAQSAMA